LVVVGLARTDAAQQPSAAIIDSRMHGSLKPTSLTIPGV
jgi:hypothetical protein